MMSGVFLFDLGKGIGGVVMVENEENSEYLYFCL